MSARYKTSTSANNGGAGTLVLNTPTGTVDGDTLITFIENPDGRTVTTLSGWTKLHEVADESLEYLAAYWKIASGEGSTYTWTLSSSTRASGAVVRCDLQAASPISASAMVADGSAGARTTSPTFANTITPAANCLLLMAVGGNPTNGNTTNFSAYAITTSNPSWTEIENPNDTGTTSSGLGVAYAIRPEATATGNSSATVDNATYNVCCIVAIAPLITNVTETPSVLSIVASVQNPTVTGGANVSAGVNSITASVQAPVVSFPVSTWVNEDKSSNPSFTNTSKS